MSRVSPCVRTCLTSVWAKMLVPRERTGREKYDAMYELSLYLVSYHKELRQFNACTYLDSIGVSENEKFPCPSASSEVLNR